MFIYWLTNTIPYFASRNYDISAIPIAFIYIVNGALFIGLLKLIRQKVFKGNTFFKYMMAVIAILGVAVVLFGTATAPNGISYLLISFLFILVGNFFIKKQN